MEYIVVKWVHILSSTLLFGTGIGSAFYLLFASLSRDTRTIAFVTRYVVIADWLFTATTVVIQPFTGIYMLHQVGIPMTSRWIFWSLVLYTIAIACWLPVAWLQVQMRNLAQRASTENSTMPALYWRYFKLWVALGFPAFFAFVTIFYFMVAKPG
ncbi:DUF2269 family protein [Methylophilus methylotrophus]|uniref:DUF2269 family protein n=1 Tax=Methylophilus methylotrophus TaxID=17 RepID=UPI00037CAB08|nr:DUF2269 family protein [Methylophilus methylotrophus]